MSFSTRMKLSSGNTYNSHARQQIPALEEDTTVETELYASEKTDKTIARYSPDRIDEKIKTNLEPLYAQISALTEMMDRLFRGNSAREFTTATTREQLRLQSQSPLVDSRLPSVLPLTSAEYSPDSREYFHSPSICRGMPSMLSDYYN